MSNMTDTIYLPVMLCYRYIRNWLKQFMWTKINEYMIILLVWTLINSISNVIHVQFMFKSQLALWNNSRVQSSDYYSWGPNGPRVPDNVTFLTCPVEGFNKTASSYLAYMCFGDEFSTTKVCFWNVDRHIIRRRFRMLHDVEFFVNISIRLNYIRTLSWTVCRSVSGWDGPARSAVLRWNRLQSPAWLWDALLWSGCLRCQSVCLLWTDWSYDRRTAVARHASLLWRTFQRRVFSHRYPNRRSHTTLPV